MKISSRPQIATFSDDSLKDVEAILEAHDLGTAKRGLVLARPGSLRS
jgi:hypothetical protein